MAIVLRAVLYSEARMGTAACICWREVESARDCL